MKSKRAIPLFIFALLLCGSVARAEFDDEDQLDPEPEALPLLRPKQSPQGSVGEATPPPSEELEESLEMDESREQVLQPRKRTGSAPLKKEIPTLRPRRPGDPKPVRFSPWELTNMSTWLQTPLVNQSGFERRFSTIGLAGLVSFPLWRLSETTFGGIQTGLAFNLSRLSLTQPALQFASLIIDIPLNFQVVFAMDKKNSFAMELFVGGVFRALEYDSRPTTDGGFGLVRSSTKFLPEGGLGISYRVSPGLVLRLRASYLLLAAGLEFPL